MGTGSTRRSRRLFGACQEKSGSRETLARLRLGGEVGVRAPGGRWRCRGRDRSGTAPEAADIVSGIASAVGAAQARLLTPRSRGRTGMAACLSRATSRGPGLTDPRRCEDARRLRARAEAARGSAPARAAAELRSSRITPAAALPRLLASSAAVRAVAPSPPEMRGGCARAETPQAPERARAAAELRSSAVGTGQRRAARCGIRQRVARENGKCEKMRWASQAGLSCAGKGRATMQWRIFHRIPIPIVPWMPSALWHMYALAQPQSTPNCDHE